MAAVDEPLYLAIDQGSHASRAIVFDDQGGVLARAHAEINTLRPRDDWVEHDPDALLEATRHVVDESARALGGDVKRIQSAGLATQRSSIVCWDRDSGQALTNVISWQDRRAADWLANFESSADRVHAITGLVLSPHYGASKLRWCLDHVPEVAACLGANRLALGPLSSFLAHRLADGQPPLADPANASRTLLWDYRARDWSQELLELFGVPRSALPASAPSRHDFGSIELGTHRCPLTVVTGDQSAALFGFGEPATDTVYANLGTGAFLQQVVGGEPVAAPGLLSSVVYQDDRRSMYVLEGTVNGAGGALIKVADELGLDREYMKANSAHWLEQVQDPPLFLNGVGGLGAPYWVADFPTRFVDGSKDHRAGNGGSRNLAGRGDAAAGKIVAVMESIVFLLAVNLEAFAQCAPRPRHLVVTGGLAAVDPLCQRLADLSGLPVTRPQIKEATARGLAFLLTPRPADWASETGQSDFMPIASPGLQQRYQRWRHAMDESVPDTSRPASLQKRSRRADGQ